MHGLAFISGSSFQSSMNGSLDYLNLFNLLGSLLKSGEVMFGNKKIESSLYSDSSCAFSCWLSYIMLNNFCTYGI
jgi:hypothetical protein